MVVSKFLQGTVMDMKADEMSLLTGWSLNLCRAVAGNAG